MKRQLYPLALCSAAMLAAMSINASAAAEADFAPSATLSCADIEFSDFMQTKYPEIQDACINVVESEGKKFAEVKIAVTHIQGHQMKFRFIEADGSRSEEQEVTFPKNFRANVEGRSMYMTDVARGQELNVYLPADRWAIQSMAESGTQPSAEYVEMAAYDMLPDTASPLPLMALGGSAFLGVAIFLRGLRRRLSLR